MGFTAPLSAGAVLIAPQPPDVVGFVSPGEYTWQSGTFVAGRATVDVEMALSCSYYEGPTGKAALRLLYAPAATASPLNRRQEGQLNPGVAAVDLGGVSSDGFFGRRRLTGLTPGAEYKWELTVVIVGYQNHVTLPETPQRVVCAKHANVRAGKPYEFNIAAVGLTKLHVVRSDHQGSAVDELVTGAGIALPTAGANTKGLAITPDGKKAVVTNLESNSVSIADLTTLAAVTTVAAPASRTAPWGVAITPDGVTAWVAFTGNPARLIPLNLATGTWGAEVALSTAGALPFDVDINPAGTRLYVAGVVSAGVEIINLTANGTVGSYSKKVSADASIAAIAFAPDGAKAYVISAGKIFIVDVTAETITSTAVDAAIIPAGAGVLGDGTTLMVASAGAGAGTKQFWQFNLPDLSLYAAWPNTPPGSSTPTAPGGQFEALAITPNGSIIEGCGANLNIFYGGQFNCRPSTPFFGERLDLRFFGAA